VADAAELDAETLLVAADTDEADAVWEESSTTLGTLNNLKSNVPPALLALEESDAPPCAWV
jgi:hypothetical protein